LPPRGGPRRRGVFATRSPHRPNPIGLTAVTLLGVEGRTILIGNCDLVDGTPILDIKPYINSIDAFPEAKKGWLEELEVKLAEAPSFNVSFSPLALTQLEWLHAEWNVNFVERAVEILSRDPSPHRTRRISRAAFGQFRMGCGAWRLFFTISGKDVIVDRIDAGYPSRLLNSDSHGRVPDREAQLAFILKWPSASSIVSQGLRGLKVNCFW